MTRAVAFLRGIGPGNPNMRNDKLRAVCAGVGLQGVATVISSGNIVFDIGEWDLPALEAELEQAWARELGFESTTIIRSEEDLSELVRMRPFGDLEHTAATYLLVTFSKDLLSIDFPIPHRPVDRDYEIVAATNREVFSVTDTTTERTPDVMAWVETRFGKGISSRTWLTVHRVLRRMGRKPGD